MSDLFEILSYSSGSIFWGALIAIACLVLFFFLIQGWYKDAVFTPASYICGGILGILLFYQCTLICGTMTIYRIADTYESILNRIIMPYLETQGDVNATVGEGDEIIKQLIQQNPLLSYYVSGGEFVGYKISELPQAIVSALKEYCFWYIVRRILWSIAFVGVAAFIVIKTMGKKQTKRRSSRETCPARRETSRPSRRNRRTSF